MKGDEENVKFITEQLNISKVRLLKAILTKTAFDVEPVEVKVEEKARSLNWE